MKNLSTRSRIILLVVLAALPALGLTIYSAWDERARAQADTRDDLSRFAKLAAQQQAQIIEGAKQTLTAISLMPSAVRTDQQRCNQYLAEMLKKSSGIYHSMGIYHADGLLVCNAVPWQGKIFSPDRLYFKLAVSTGKFTVGEYQVGRVTRLTGINFGYPITDEQGKVTDVAFAALDLARFNQVAAATPLPNSGVLAVIDHDGIILSRYPEAAGRVGQKLRNAQLLSAMAGKRAGIIEGKGTDGIERLSAFDSVVDNPDGTIPVRVLVSMPLNVVYAEANHALLRNLAGILIATILLLVAAWYGAEIFVLRSVRTLLAATKRVQVGRLSVRTGLIHGKDELAQLGSAFDEMVRALQNRESDLARAMDDLRQQTITDALTGLYNRRFLYDALPRELSRARRKNTTTAVLMIDIDHFKQVNDTYGHEAGDQVLKAVADMIKASVRYSDYCFRYGGEEISVVLPDAAADGARMRAEAIRIAAQSLEVAYPGRKMMRITLSIGVALFPEHGSDAESLLRAADEALYEAKGCGRNRVIMYAKADTNASLV